MKQKRNERGGESQGANQSGDGKPGDGKPGVAQPWHPHDRLFKEIFSTIEAQQDLVTLSLPRKITAHFRMNTLRESAQETKTGRIDLLLEVQTKSGATEDVYILVEHKSSNAPLVAVQLLEYVGGILRRMGKPPLPVIHPVVFYHGTSPWTAPPELIGLHGAADLPAARHVPFGGYPVNLRYHLFNLNDIPPESIRARTRARAFAGIIALKYVRRKLHKTEADLIAKATTQIDLPEGYRRDLTVYLFRLVPREHKDDLVTAMVENSYNEEEGRRMKSIADALIEEGLEKGLEQGLARGKVELLIRQLSRRFGLTAEEEMIVRSCRDGDRLDTAAEIFADDNSSKVMVLKVLSNRD